MSDVVTFALQKGAGKSVRIVEWDVTAQAGARLMREAKEANISAALWSANSQNAAGRQLLDHHTHQPRGRDAA